MHVGFDLEHAVLGPRLREVVQLHLQLKLVEARAVSGFQSAPSSGYQR
jgi:hypothetical protein